MIKIDLITGFLGSGKTTFVKKYAKYFMDQGQRIGILENDYGAVNVDMMMLKELRGDNCELEMVAGACDKDCHARRFKTKLISMAMSKYDRVIIEPSGIFDVDEFFDVIRDEPLDNWYEIGNVITILDATLPSVISKNTAYYLASQAASAGAVVMSKTQLVSENEIKFVQYTLLDACEMIKLRRNLENSFITTNWDDWDDDYIANNIANCGHKESSFIKLMNRDNTNWETLYYLDVPMDTIKLSDIATKLMDDSYGDVFRIKGFFQEEDNWYQANITGSKTMIEPIPDGQQVLIVIGEKLQKEAINNLITGH